MLLLVLFLIGLVPASALAWRARRRSVRAGLAAAAVAGWAAYAIYASQFAACPAVGECDKGLGIVFVGAIATGWLAGLATVSLLSSHRDRRQ